MRQVFHRVFTVGVYLALAYGLWVGLLGASLRLWPLPPWPPHARVVEAHDGSLLGAVLSADQQWRLPTRRDELSDELVTVLLEKEDRWFYYHPGVNPASVLRALGQNLRSGRRVSGASTLTMQLARMLEPGERSWGKKLAEAARALQLEWCYSKDQLLIRYCTLAPCGGNVQGFAAASRLYFGRPASALSLAQSTTLVLLPGRPTALMPGRADDQLLAARNRWLTELGRRARFAADALEAARLEPLGISRHPLPRLAPHQTRRLLARAPQSERIRSTIRPALQAQVEAAVRQYVSRLKNYQVTAAAALVVHTQSRQVLAYVGSPDFDDADAAGQVDGVQAVRSPGSALKPLIYAMAFDRGLITPRARLLDVPTRFGGGYEPENYDQSFSGSVTAREALERSLNLPAIRLLEQVGTDAFIQTLSQSGFGQIRSDAERLGLSAAVGGCGVRLSELVGLFAALADSGAWHPLVDTVNAPLGSPLPIVSPAAAWLTADILTTLIRPDLPNNFQNSTRLPRLAWKTGTSYGRRDAWAVGFTREVTVGVWVGNFSGVGSPALSGADVATPLLFQLVQTVHPASAGGWLPRPPEVLPRSVCSVTGQVADTFCHDRVEDWYIQGRAPFARCAHLAPVWVSADGRESYTPACAPPTAVRRLYPNPPAELLAHLQATRQGVELPPPLARRCAEATPNAGLRVLSPADGADYFFRRGQARRLALRAAAPPDAGRLHWFVGGTYRGAVAAGEAFAVEADTGRTTVAVTDDRGRTHRVAITVRQY